MSWDATLYCEHGHEIADWNYTHNCNGMANAVLDDGPTWWQRLDGMTAREGADFLYRIVTAMTERADELREMNPENGWGDFRSFRNVLWEMHDKADALSFPGRWEVLG